MEDKLNKIVDTLQSTDMLAVVLAIIILIIAVLLWRFHRDPNQSQFDLTDLLMENGKLSKISVAFLLTLLVTTWMMIYMTINKQMTEGYLAIYTAAWIAPIVTRLFKVSPTLPTSITDNKSGGV